MLHYNVQDNFILMKKYAVAVKHRLKIETTKSYHSTFLIT